MNERERRSGGRDAALASDGAGVAVSDGRLLRGARSRRTVLRHAVDVASLDGLNGLSLGRLASDLGFSKSGVQALFGTKENLQVAAAGVAREAFDEAVIAPALSSAPGAARVRALIDGWIVYAEEPLFPGGCFWAANQAVFDSQPGPVRDALTGQQRAWRDLIAGELRHAAELGEIGHLDPELAAFEIDAVLIATNTAMRVGEERASDKVRRVSERLLAPAHADVRRR